MKSISSFVLLLLLIASTKAQMKDAEGNRYKTVKIGNQTWMAENLNVGMFSNGDRIPQARSRQEWEAFVDQKKPAWAYYAFDSIDAQSMGKLYNYHAVIDTRGLAPKDWIIPSKQDWKQLIMFVGGDSIAGKKLKSKTGWNRQWLVQEDSSTTNPNGIDSYGFNARPNSEDYGSWWTSTTYKNYQCLWEVSIWYSYEFGYDGVKFGFLCGKAIAPNDYGMLGVRCLKKK